MSGYTLCSYTTSPHCVPGTVVGECASCGVDVWRAPQLADMVGLCGQCALELAPDVPMLITPEVLAVATEHSTVPGLAAIADGLQLLPLSALPRPMLEHAFGRRPNRKERRAARHLRETA